MIVVAQDFLRRARIEIRDRAGLPAQFEEALGQAAAARPAQLFAREALGQSDTDRLRQGFAREVRHFAREAVDLWVFEAEGHPNTRCI